MPKKRTSQQQLLAENTDLHARLEKAEQKLSEIFSGGVDALVIPGADEAQLFTLQGADQAYRLLIEEMSEGALRMTVEGAILYANRRFAEMLKAPLEKVIGSDIRTWVAPDSQDALQLLLRIDDKEAYRRGEVMLLASDGTLVPGYLSVNLLQTEERQKSFSMLATDLSKQKQIDAAIAAEKLSQEMLAVANRSRRALLSVIEDQKQAQEGLRESEENFRQLFEGSRDALMTLSPPSWQFTGANEAALQLFGAESVAQFVGLRPWDVSPERQPDGRPSVDKMSAIIATVMKEGSSFFEWEHRHIDGTSFPADVLLTRIETGGQSLIQATVRDITERKRTEDERDQAAHLLGERLKELSGLYAVSTAVADRELSVEQVLQRIVEAIPPSFRYPEITCARLSLQGGQYLSGDFKETAWRLGSAIASGEKEDGELEVFYTEERPASDAGPFLQEEQSLVAVIASMTGEYLRFHHAMSKLRQFRTLLDDSNDIVLLAEIDTGRVMDANGRASVSLGYSRDELLGMKVMDFNTRVSGKPAWNRSVAAVKKAGASLLETAFRRKDGSTFPVEVSVKSVSQEGKDYMVAIARDINERQQAEAALKRSEKEFRNLAEAMPQIVWITRPDGRNIYFNQQWMDYTGLTLKESLGHGWNKPFHPDDQKAAWETWQNATTNLTTYSIESRLRRADGVYRWWLIRGVPVKDADDKVVKWFGTCTDIHDMKSAEQEIIRTNRALKTLSAGNLALVEAASEDELLQAVTSVIVEQAGYIQAAVDYAEDDPEKRLTPKAWSGYEGDSYWAEDLSWADTEQDQLPVSKAIRTGKTQICHDVAADPAFEPWREHVMAHGYASNIALPMSEGGRTFAVLSIYASDATAFNDEEIRLLEELANDLAYGIVALRSRKANEQHAVILQQSLEQSIQTIAATVEARDPYTAGHQQRVGELATAIAQEMDLPEEKINGIHLAAIIHDLGKIHVPAEILSKPGRLTDIEYLLIKQHSQNGYDILKDVKFPWPIADMILQHHERLDGSGYPQGLKGDQILLQSRILAVADVVEAMSSHRPYRASMGIEPALEEIRRGRGSLYDPAVADACLKLFAEKEFAFSTCSY